MRHKKSLAALVGLLLLVGGCGTGTTIVTGFGTITVTSIAPALDCVGGTPFTITGGDFSQIVGAPCTVRFRATVGTPFLAGSSATVEVPGLITSDTTVTGVSPPAVMCGPVSFSAFVTVILPSGVAAESTTPIATFLAPTITSIVPTAFPAAIPTTYTLTGTGFGPMGGIAFVSWTAISPIFAGSTSITTTGVITSATTITGLSPEATVCGAAVTFEPAGVTQVQLPGGCCTPTGTFLPVTFDAPRVTSVTNTAVGSPYFLSTAPAMFGSAVPEPFLVTGTGFGPTGSLASVRFSSATGSAIYGGGSSSTIDLVGLVTSPTTIIAAASPEAAICGPVSDPQNVMVTVQNGSCSPSAIDGLSAALLIAPTLTAVDNIDRNLGNTSGATHPAPNSMGYFYSHLPERFQLTGTDFGPLGGTALVTMTYSNANGFALPPTPFPSGAGPETSASIVLLCTITSRTTIEGVMPEYRMALTRGAGGIAGAGIFSHVRPIANLSFVALLEGGSCNGTTFDPAGVEVTAHTVSPGVGAAGGPGTDVVSTLRLGEVDPDMVTITGIGFGPPGPCEVIFEDTTAFSGFDGGAAEGNGTEATIVSDTTITCRLPTITAPRLTADMLARVVVRLSNGNEAFCNQDVNFVAPPTISTVVNSDMGAGNGFFDLGSPSTAFNTCISSTMTITGTGFDTGAGTSTDVLVYATEQGVDANQAPVRQFGTGTPPAGAPALPVTDLGLTITQIGDTSIAGETRVTPDGPALDPDDNGLIPYTVRTLNPDGQFHELSSATHHFQLRSTEAALVATSANVRNNPSIALDPSSFTDDFMTGTGTNDGVAGQNVTLCSADAVTPVAGFSSTDIFLTTSLDGGVTFTPSGAWTGAALSVLDGRPAAALRNYAQVRYDAFGHLWVCYLAEDFVGGGASVAYFRSLDQGATVAGGFFVPGTAGLFGVPDIDTGPDPASGAGSEQAVVAVVDHSGLGGSEVETFASSTASFGGALVPSAIFTVSDAPLFGIRRTAQVAVGPSGEVSVGWVDALFPIIGPPPPNDILVDTDRDGLFGGTYGFTTDTIADTIPFAFLPLPAAPDTGPQMPQLDMAIARAGTHSGRLVIAYENVIPADFITTFVDHASMSTKFSDDNGLTWPGTRTVPHQVNNADQFIPALASDPVTGRFYLTYYDTSVSAPFNTSAERRSTAADDGDTWGDALAISLFTTFQFPDLDTDYGLFAGVSAYNGHVVAAWCNALISGTSDPSAASYQQDADSSP